MGNMIHYGNGVAPEKVDLRDYKGVAKTNTFPDTFELTMMPVKNQGAVSSCVAHALASVIEYFDCVENGKFTAKSVLYIYGNRRYSDWKESGMRIRDALKTCCEYGDVEYRELPGNYEVPDAIDRFEKVGTVLSLRGSVHGIKRYFRLDSTKAIKECLMNCGPVLIAVPWYSDNYVYKDVLHITGNKAKEEGLHCMVVYGWEPRGWKVQNSWGLLWGNRGKAILPFDTKLSEAWGLEDREDTESIEIKKPFASEFWQTVVKILNRILNRLLRR